MIKHAQKFGWILLMVLSLSISCKDKDSSDSVTDGSSSTDTNSEYDQKSEKAQELMVVSSVSSEDTKDTSFNPEKAPADLKAFSLEEVLRHSDMKGIALGMSAQEIKDYNLKANQSLESINSTDQNGNRRTYRIVTGGVPVVELSMNGDTVNAITFLSRNAFPKNMIGVDYSYKVLATKYPNLNVNGNQVTTTNDGKKLIFLMETMGSDGKTMPDSAQIVEMTVMNQIES